MNFGNDEESLEFINRLLERLHHEPTGVSLVFLSHPELNAAAVV